MRKQKIIFGFIGLLSVAAIAYATNKQGGYDYQKQYKDACAASKADNYDTARKIFHKLLSQKNIPENIILDSIEEYAFTFRDPESYCEYKKIDQLNKIIPVILKNYPNSWQIYYKLANTLIFLPDSIILNNKTKEITLDRYCSIREPKTRMWIRYVTRVRQLQLMNKAMELINKLPKSVRHAQRKKISNFHLSFAGTIFPDKYWKLRLKTDLSKLPKPIKLFNRHNQKYFNPLKSEGAPVDANGNPIFYPLPKTWDSAENDGQRWRFLLAQAVKYNPLKAIKTQAIWANFLRSQFGCFTIFSSKDFNSQSKAGIEIIEQLPHLKDNETYANLATGIKKITLPDEYNFIKVYEDIKEDSIYAAAQIARCYEKRMQYDKAAKAFEFINNNFESETYDSLVHNYSKIAYEYYNLNSFCINRYNTSDYSNPLDKKYSAVYRALLQNEYIPGTARLIRNQILEKYGVAICNQVQIAGNPIKFKFDFRNAKKVNFTAYELDYSSYILSLMRNIKKNKKAKLNFPSIGLDIVNKKNFFKKWEVSLKPAKNHATKLATIDVPFKKPGFYLIESNIDGGNTSYSILKIINTVIVKRTFLGKPMYFFADAKTGKGIPNMSVKLNYIGKSNSARLDIESFDSIFYRDEVLTYNQISDKNGFLFPKFTDTEFCIDTIVAIGYNRFACLQTEPNNYDLELIVNTINTQTVVKTDRPIYKPKQTVHIKVWNNVIKSDIKNRLAAKSQKIPEMIQLTKNRRLNSISNKNNISLNDLQVRVLIQSPDNEIIHDKRYPLDEYNTASMNFNLPDNLKLGRYKINASLVNKISDQEISNNHTSFYVEEFRKPEFYVNISTAGNPAKFGDKVKVKISANYYYGKPVSDGILKYTVVGSVRFPRTIYPKNEWDWLYDYNYRDMSFTSRLDYNCLPSNKLTPTINNLCQYRDLKSFTKEYKAVKLNSDGTAEIEIDTSEFENINSYSSFKLALCADVTDPSQRTAYDRKSIYISQKRFKIFTKLNKGFYNKGDTIKASIISIGENATAVEGKGKLTVYKISRSDKGRFSETIVHQWNVNPNKKGQIFKDFPITKTGDYRLNYELTNKCGVTLNGGECFKVYNKLDKLDEKIISQKLELIPEHNICLVGQKVKLRINSSTTGAYVYLTKLPCDNKKAPQLVKLTNGTALVEILVTKRDAPNFSIEAFIVADGKIHTEQITLYSPPADKILNVKVTSDKLKYKAGSKAKIKVKVTDYKGAPFKGSLTLTMYDRAIEYFAGYIHNPSLKYVFWSSYKYIPEPEYNISHQHIDFHDLDPRDTKLIDAIHISNTMYRLSIFESYLLYDKYYDRRHIYTNKFLQLVYNHVTPEYNRYLFLGPILHYNKFESIYYKYKGSEIISNDQARFVPVKVGTTYNYGLRERRLASGIGYPGGGKGVFGGGGDFPIRARNKFADSAKWIASLETDKNGVAEIEVDLPENLTEWQTKVWCIGKQGQVGSANLSVKTFKNFMVKAQSPRFMITGDTCVFAPVVANYNNYPVYAKVKISPNSKGVISLRPDEKDTKTIYIPANSQRIVKWVIDAADQGDAKIKLTAIACKTKEDLSNPKVGKCDTDGVSSTFKVYTKGTIKTVSHCGTILKNEKSASFEISVPKKRIPKYTKLKIKVANSLASTMLEALPYLIKYPYGCSEQTLNKFLPCVIAKQTLEDLNISLKDLKNKSTIKNSAIVNDKKLDKLISIGVNRLDQLQNKDGGWSWYGEQTSNPHITAMIMNGLYTADTCGAKVSDTLLKKGAYWLRKYSANRVKSYLKQKENADKKEIKFTPTNVDAIVALACSHDKNHEYDFLELVYDNRKSLSPYGLAVLGLAMHKTDNPNERDAIIKQLSTMVHVDKKCQTAHIQLDPKRDYWTWDNSDIETQAAFLKLLVAANKKPKLAVQIVRYLVNQRKNATYWESTRDTAYCIEAIAKFLTQEHNQKSSVSAEIYIDNKLIKKIKLSKSDLMSPKNNILIPSNLLTSGKHKVEIRKIGKGLLYFNAYMTNFNLEDKIIKAGSKLKISRKYYKLTPITKVENTINDAGKVVKIKSTSYDRVEIKNDDLKNPIQTGELVEVELTIEADNYYEYIMIEDFKPACLTPTQLNSGYDSSNNAYIEMRTNRTCIFITSLEKGKKVIKFRMFAELAGMFTARPATIEAMYNPDIKGNSSQFRIRTEQNKLLKPNK